MVQIDMVRYCGVTGMTPKALLYNTQHKGLQGLNETAATTMECEQSTKGTYYQIAKYSLYS